jgi:PAS domain S-box-containing protein
LRSLIADDSTRPQLSFHLPLDPARLLRARHRIRDFLHAHDVQPRAIEEIVLAIEEAMTNAVRHSGGEDLAVGLGFDGTDVIAVVRDHGRGFDVASFDPERTPDLLAPSGRGLFLIAHLMDELELHSQGGMVVRAVKRDVLGAGEGTEPGLGESVPGAQAHRDARQQAMLDEVEEAFFALDWEYRYLYVNRAAETMWHRRKEEHLGHALWQVYPRIPPVVSQALRETMELGIPTLVEAASLNGGRWREYRAYPTSFGVAAYVRDIDERKRKELERDELLAALRESEKRLSALVSASSEVLYRMDPAWTEMRELRGHGFLTDTGEPDRAWLDRYIPSDDQAQVLRAIAEAIHAKQAFELEHRVKRADGQLGWVASRAVPILDENGTITEWFGAAADISDRKQAEGMRLRYELLAGESQDLILFVTPQGKIIEANRAAEAAYGYSRQELLALTIRDLRAAETRSDVARQIAEAEACGIRFETVHRRKSGELFPVEVCSRGGQIEGRRVLVSVVRDVTERKRLEEELREREEFMRRLIDSSPDCIKVLDLEGRLLSVSPAGQRLLEIDDIDSVLGTSWVDFWSEADHQRAREALNTARQGETARFQACCPTMGGQAKWWDVLITPMHDPSGRPERLLAVSRDVSERRQAEEALRASEERVRQKLESVLSPQGDIAALELADLIDVAALQQLMGDFYQLAHIPMSIIDDAGRVLVGVGWQDICSEFHRVHVQTERHCLESDTTLSAGLEQGESRLYRCKNNMWDMATPIVVDGRKLGNIFTGQFFFSDEVIDRELYRAQARCYGFDEAQYLAALDRVPRLERESVEHGIAVFRDLARMLSQLGHSNLKLARLLAERERLNDALRASEERFRLALRRAPLSIAVQDRDLRYVWAYNQDPSFPTEIVGKVDADIFAAEEAQRLTVLKRRVLEEDDALTQQMWLARANGRMFCEITLEPMHDEQGRVTGVGVASVDLTSMKRAEEELKALYESQRDIALTLQRNFRHEVPLLARYEVALVSVPSIDPGLVGGDLWDLFELPDGRTLAAVGDVAGKGIAAAGLTQTIRSALRALAQVAADPAFILGNLNRLLLNHVSEEEQFVTALVLIIDSEHSELVMASAGHPGPLHLNARDCSILEPIYGTPLGAFPASYTTSRHRFSSDDYLVLYTDGLTEARRRGELFTEERVIETARDLYGRSAHEVADALREAAESFAGHFRDDLEILVLRSVDGRR